MTSSVDVERGESKSVDRGVVVLPFPFPHPLIPSETFGRMTSSVDVERGESKSVDVLCLKENEEQGEANSVDVDRA